MNTDTLVLLHIFLEYVLLLLVDNVMKSKNNFQVPKVQPQGFT